jgi:hypothetical protein
MPTTMRGTDDMDSGVEAANSTDSGWQTPTLLNSWVDFGPPYVTAQYRKIGKIVYVKGFVVNGTAGWAIFTLPVGFRPSATLRFPAIANSALGTIQIEATGNFTALTGSNVWFAMDCSFLVD